MDVRLDAQARPESANLPRRVRLDRLVVATAGDAVSAGAIHMGVELSRRTDASVVAVGIAPALSPAMHGVLAPSPLVSNQDGRLELLSVVRATLAHVPGTERWEKRAIVGTPATAIAELAGDDAHTLILMGLGHHGRLDRVFGGETTVSVIKHARVPVLAVMPEARALPRHAIAAVDFSEASLTAAAIAAELLDDQGTLTLVHVCALGGANAHPGDLIDLYRTGSRARLHEAVQRLQRRTHRHVTGIMLDGRIPETLLDYADEAKADLIALGGHERGLVDRVLLGSIRTGVVRAAKCSVLIAPPERQAADA